MQFPLYLIHLQAMKHSSIPFVSNKNHGKQRVKSIEPIFLFLALKFRPFTTDCILHELNYGGFYSSDVFDTTLLFFA
jgi:hypothetical protein